MPLDTVFERKWGCLWHLFPGTLTSIKAGSGRKEHACCISHKFVPGNKKILRTSSSNNNNHGTTSGRLFFLCGKYSFKTVYILRNENKSQPGRSMASSCSLIAHVPSCPTSHQNRCRVKACSYRSKDAGRLWFQSFIFVLLICASTVLAR